MARRDRRPRGRRRLPGGDRIPRPAPPAAGPHRDARGQAAILDDRRAQADAGLRRANADASAAVGLTSGPVWAGLAKIPFVGAPLDTVRGIAGSAHDLTHAVLPEVVRAADGLSPHTLRVAGNKINLAALQGALPALTSADERTRMVQRDSTRLAGSKWLPPVNSARHQLAHLLEQLRATLDDSSAGARLVPPMLGNAGPRRYLVVFENDADARGLRGPPGEFAIVRAEHGTLTFEKFGNDGDITARATSPMPPEFVDAWDGYGAQDAFVNSDVSPHFPDAVQVWMSMWQRQTHQTLDGAIATDPTALSYLLAVTGPTKTKDRTPVTTQNVVALTQSTAYFRYPTDKDAPARKAFLLDLARAAADQVVHGGGDVHALLNALGHAVGERRLLVWSNHPDEEAQLAALPLGGVLPETKQPFVAVAINNAGGNKLDYHLDRAVAYRAGSCSGNHRRSTVTITLRNDAPTHGLPIYVRVRSDNPPGDVVPGSNKLLVTLLATAGAQMTGVTIDGTRADAETGTQRGHPMFTVTVDINPQQTRTVVFSLEKPRVRGAVQTVAQPLVGPLRQDLPAPSC